MKSDNELYSPKATIGMIDQIIFLILEGGTDFVPEVGFGHLKVK